MRKRPDYVELQQIAAVYLSARGFGKNFGRPTEEVARVFELGRSTAARRVRECRDLGLIPDGYTASAVYGVHHPVQAKLSSPPCTKFSVCRRCLVPWPCNEAPTNRKETR